MTNIQVIDKETLQTTFGILGAISSYDVYDSGELKSVILKGENVVITHAGELTPYYTETPRRKYKPSVKFYKDGMIKSVSLENQQELITPIGELLAELVTFYNTGELHRVFPLDGKLSGFWGEEEEKELHIPLTFDLDFTEFTACISCLCFYKTGDIKSITLYPNEEIKINKIAVRHGLSLYESGALQSCEPAKPTMIDTPLGKILAFDPEAVGVTADSNSLVFYEDGTLKSLITTAHKVQVQDENGKMKLYAPQIVPAFVEGGDESIIGLNINFCNEGVSFGREEKIYSFKDCGFTLLDFGFQQIIGCNPSDCASCSLCH
ncbi:MAG: hypothetical protein R3Y09_03805 [Clostridia bacterium]